MTDAIQKAREALEAAREALKVSRVSLSDATRWKASEAIAQIDAALAALDAETEVKVRELEWDRDDKPGVHFADTCIGTYYAHADGTLKLDAVQLSFVRGRQWHETEAAAQADFERRIRSALVPPEARS